MAARAEDVVAEKISYSGRLMVSVSGSTLTKLEELIIAHPMTAGIILFARNCISKEQLKLLIGNIQAIAISSGKIGGLPIFADQEGGKVQRLGLKVGIEPLPNLRTIGEQYEKDVREKGETAALAGVQSWGHKMARELMSFGVIPLCPVLDLHNPESIVIGGLRRAFHHDPRVCAKLAGAYIAGMNEAGMPATGKHFPGHGTIIGDTHTDVLTDTRDLTTIESQDLIPFVELIKRNKLAAIMPAHIIFSQVDSATAGTSSTWLKDILRTNYCFDGIVISDCLSMVGAGGDDNLTKVIASLDSGVDIALLCNQPGEEVLRVLNGLAVSRSYGMTQVMMDRYNTWVHCTCLRRLELKDIYESAIAATAAPPMCFSIPVSFEGTEGKDTDDKKSRSLRPQLT